MNVAKYYKGYYMMTAKCNLACSYCVLENSPEQIAQELNLEQKMELISHLYETLNFRSLTLSGGEALVIGKDAPNEFVTLLKFLRRFKSDTPERNLRLSLYTNGIKLSEPVADAMVGVIDEVSITIDSHDKDLLRQLGRNRTNQSDYFQNAVRVCRMLSERGIKVKLHTVVSTFNESRIGNEVSQIQQSLISAGAKIEGWKFYQYMSYDLKDIDERHKISTERFKEIEGEIRRSLSPPPYKLHFKDNSEMNESLFNILAYGNAQYMNAGDSWTSSKRTEYLGRFKSISDLFEQTSISKEQFDKYHSYYPESI